MPLRRLLTIDLLNRLRLAVLVLMVLVLAPALFRLSRIKGLIRTIRIDGGSMAETLCGTHFRVVCQDCGITFRCDGDFFPKDRRAVCPNCGFRDNELRDEDLRRGDRVLVDSWPYLWSAPQRGDVVMLREPVTDATKQQFFAVKRVAALPEERLALRDGDLHSGEDRLAKSLPELREMAVLVHDNDHRPRTLPDSPRWKPLSPTSKWQAASGGFHFNPSQSASEEIDWLAYEHWRCTANPLPRVSSAQIQDNDGYNQAENHELNDVHDLLLVCRIRADADSALSVLARDGSTNFQARLDLQDSRATIEQNGRPILTIPLPRSGEREFRLEAALCDGRFLLARDGQLLADVSYDRNQPAMPQQRGTARLQIGGERGHLEVLHLQVFRDIYYLAPNGRGGEWQADVALPANRFALLGDNPPISIDSRHWSGNGVPREDIIGKVYGLERDR